MVRGGWGGETEDNENRVEEGSCVRWRPGRGTSEIREEGRNEQGG